MTQIWLFQVSPRSTHLQGVTLRVGGEDVWDITRYRNDLQVSDPVIIWREGDTSGKNTGIVAFGEVADTAFFEERPEFPTFKFWIRLRYTHLLPQTFLRDDIKRNPVLHYMQIISIPFATNAFSVTDEEWNEIRQHVGML